MNSQEARSNSLQLTQQRSQKLDKKTPLKRIRISDNARLNQQIIQNRTSLSYIHTTSTSQINFSKHDIPNSPSSIVQLEQYFKEQNEQTRYGNQNSQKGLKQRNFQEHLEKIEINKLESEHNTLPPLKESSKQQIENNSNTISQLVQSCKKLNITSFGNIPFNNMSPKSEKGFQVHGANKIQLFNTEQINQIINPNLKVQIVPNIKDSTKNINQSTTQNYIISQIQNAGTLQDQNMVKEKLQSLQSFCSPQILSSKKLKQEGAPESKVESFATPSSMSSKTEETKNYLMKKQFSEGILKLMKTDSPLRMQQSSFYAKNSYFNNVQNLNKTQTKDSQTYSSVDKNTNQQQSNNSSLGKKRVTMQEFFTNRLNTKNNSQQDKMQSYDDFSIKQAHSTSIQTNSKLSSSSITQFSKLEDISKILQTQVSNALTDVPRNRADLKELIKWFELVKKQNEDQNKYNINEKRKKQLEIIQVCFKELSHQIRIDFLEREQFFKMVWNENVNYYKSFIEDFEQIKIKINTDADSEYNRVSNFYQQYIKTKDLAAEEAFLEKRNAEKKLEEIKQELMANQQIQDTLKEEVNKFKKICMFLKKKLVTVTKELEGVMQRQEDRARHSKHQLNEYFKDQMQKLKQQGLNVSQQNESTIQNLIEQLRLANENLATQQKQNQAQDQKQEQEENQKNKNNIEEEDEEQDQEDDDNFTFEYNEGGDLVQGVDQLNAVIVNTEQEVKKECKETEVDDQLRRMYMKDVEVQTKLYLVDNKFDALLYDVETMNDIFDFYVYKQQMDEQVDKFDVNQFMQQLGEQDQIENQNFVQTITNIRMDSIEESSSSNSSNSGSDSSNSSDSEESETEDQTKKQKKENKQQRKARQSKLLQNLHPALVVTTAKKDYDSLRGFQQRQSIRQRLSIRQNVFNSNRHLALYLEQYLSSNFINDVISIFAEKITGQPDSSFPSSGNILEVPSMLQAPRVVSGPRKSILNMIDSNPFVQKKRNELKQKLNQLLDPDKLKTVLDDAGLKVTSSNTESKLEKFVKIYQMSQLKGQELQVQLKGAKQMLDKYQEDLKLNSEKLVDKEQLTEEQKNEINRLEQIIKELQNELEMSLKREKETMLQMKKGTLENIEESDMQVRQKQPRIFRQRREKKEVTAFQLGKKINIEWEFQKQQNSGKQIVEKAKNKKMAKFHNFMTVKTVLKQISMLYNERMIVTKENSNYKDIEFSNFVYNFYSAQYGVKKIADQKFLILILSIKKYSQILRINIFSRFLGLQEGNMNFTTDELNKYIDVLDFINNISQAGTNFTNNESEQKYLVPYIKAVHYISQFGDTRMKPEENQELRREVENMKFMDSSKTAVLDFDQFMNRMLATYKILVNRAKQYVINAFNACDLDGNKKCNFNEWSLLNRHIEPDKFDDDQIIQIFEDNADIIEEDGEKNLSFDKFAVVSLEYELFSDEAQDRYLEITNPLQFKIKYDSLMQIWPSKSIDIQKRFYNLQNIDEETKEEWLNIIKVLDEKLNTVVFSNSNVKPLLIAYTILDRESNLLELDNIEYLKSLNNIQSQSQSPEKQSPI